LIPFLDKVVHGGMPWGEGHTRTHETAAPLGPVGNYPHPDLVARIPFLPIEFPTRLNSQAPGKRLRYGSHVLRGYSGFHEYILNMEILIVKESCATGFHPSLEHELP
jgi:hypothetical protein